MSTANTHQLLGEIKNKYGRIHEGIEMHELNTIVSETNDSLFTSLKEVVYSNQNTGGTSTESQIYNIHTDLNYKRITLDSKITTLESSITALNTEKTNLETEKTTLESKLTTDKLTLATEESNLKDFQKDKRIKEGEINLKRNEKAKKENDMKGLKDGVDKDNLRQDINLLLNDITNLTNQKDGLEFDITNQSEKIRNMQNEIRENEREIKQLEERIKRNSDSLIDPTNQKTKLEVRRDKIKRMEEEYKKFMDNGSQIFDTTKNVSEKTVAVGTAHNYDVKGDLFQSGATRPASARYSLYDGEGKPFSSGILQKVKLSDGTEVDIQGFSINPITSQIDRSATIVIKKSDTGEEITKFPINFQLDVGVSIPVDGSLDTGISPKVLNLTNKKTIPFKLHRTITGGTNLSTAYDAINIRTGGQIDRQLGHLYTTKYGEVKKAVLLKLLEDINKAAFDKLSDKQKDDFVKNLVTTGYDLDIPSFQTVFRDEITKDDFSGTEEEFEKHLLQNFDTKGEEKLKKILEDRLDSTQIGGQKSRSVIAGRALDFLNNTDMTLAARHTTLGVIESNLSAEYLETRLRQEYENKFNKVQREAFEKVLADNPEFAKLNQAQKDRLYERMQDLGTIANPVKPINLGKDAAGADITYPVNDITFAPSTHDYSLMPNAEDYNGFKVWLANQAPKDVINDEEKYRQWLRNGLVASLDNGKTHYEDFFADVAKQFTDDLNVKTTLNKTLLDFINDTNEADHVGFEADLAATLNATEPLTTNTKKRYQRLAFWTRGEPQNYLSFFSGQSHEFSNENITAGGKTFGYSGKLEIQGAESMTMSIKMKEGQEQFYKGGNPVALVRALLTSPDIEPPHARFHAGLSVVKSVTKLARDNGISLRTALTPEMLDTLPISIRTTLENGENPMVEVVEENGKLVAKVFNLNLQTKRKENEYKMFDEQDFAATQSVRDLRQGVQGLLALTNQTMNNVYSQYREARFRSGLRPGLLKKPRYGGLRNGYKKLSFTGESISVGGKSFTLDCKDGLFTFSGGDLKKPVKGRNLGDLLAYNPALRGVELKAMRVANEKMLAMYQEKLKKQKRHHNYGVIDEENHRVYIYDKHGNLGYYESNDQTFVQRWRQYTSGHRYGRIADENMPTGFRVMKRGDSVVDSESYENFLRNETVVGSMVRAMSRTHRALIAMDPW